MSAVEPGKQTPWGERPHPPRPRANPHDPAPSTQTPPPPPAPAYQAPPPSGPPPAPAFPPPPAPAPPPPAPAPPQPAPPPQPYIQPRYDSTKTNGHPNGFDNEKLGKRIVFASIVVAIAAFAFFGYRALAPKSWDPALEPYIAFVEAERGLEFTDTVDVRWADIAAELEDQTGHTHDAPTSNSNDPWSEAYRLLGLVDPDPAVSSEQAFNETLVENAAAFYEPWTETIVLPTGSTDIELSVTIVHELTHALQHQHGMLGGSGLFESPDDAVARRTLIEGDAERIALAWFWAQPESFREEYRAALGFDDDDVSEDSGDSYLAASFYASYEVGAPMVRTIIEVDGVEQLNELLRAKNVGSTERLVDPLGSSPSSSVDAIEDMTLPEGSDRAIGDLGTLTWFQALAPVIGTNAAFESLIGYDDDAFALFARGDQSCVRYSVFFDTPADGGEFIAALDNANAPGDRQLAGNEAVIDLCTPLGDPQGQKFGTILPLIVAQEAAHAHILAGETPEVARCAAIAQASTVPAVGFEEFVGWDVIIEEQAQFVADCK